MLNLIKYFLASLIFLCLTSCYKKDFNNLSLDEQVKILNNLDQDRLKTLFTKTDSIQILKTKIKNSKYVTFNKGNPIGSELAIRYTTNYLNYFWWRFDKDEIEKSVYFKKEEIETLWNSINSSGLQGEKGIRIYFARYDETISNQEFKDKMTVIIRACVNTKDLPYSDAYNVAYNYGDLCPKICGDHINRNSGGRYPESK